MKRRYFGFIGLILIALVITTAVYFYAKGYRIDFQKKTIAGTGIIQINSNPNGAAVFVDGEDNLKEATNVSLTNLTPGNYKLTLKKDGYSDWKKEVEVRAGLVTTVDAVLMPAAPDLKPVTFTGVVNPQIAPDSQKLVYGVVAEDKAGLWILDLSDRPLFFSKDPKQIVKDSQNLKFSTAKYEWSPDSKSVLVTLNVNGRDENYLLDAENLNQQFTDITANLASLKEGWLKDAEVKNKDRLNNMGEEAKKLAEGAKKIVFSPEEERVLIIKADGSVVVYDSKPYLTFDKKPQIFSLPKADTYIWYPETTQFGRDSRHLFLVRKESISVIEADGGNEATIFTGSFDPNAVFPWPNGSKFIISTSLNSGTAKLPNLYTISLQ